MIEIYKLGKTSYGGEVYALESDKYFEIPALRCVLFRPETNKNYQTLQSAVEYFNKNPSEAKSLAADYYRKWDASIGEAATEAIYLSNVSRLVTLCSWVPLGAPRGLQGTGTEKSLNLLKEADFVDNGNESLKNFCRDVGLIYKMLIDSGYPSEDAKYILPLATKTEEILQIPLGRECGKWSNYMQELYFTEAVEIGKLTKDWNTEKTGIEVDELPSKEACIPLMIRDSTPMRNYLYVVAKHSYYSPLEDTLLIRIPCSIASMHHEVRNRQERIFWPSWEETVLHPRFVMPSALAKTRRGTLSEVYRRAQDLCESLWKEGKIESAVYVQPLGKEIDAISLVHGSENIRALFMNRTCNMTPEETRHKFLSIAKSVEKSFGQKLGPRCKVENRCYHPEREKCPNFEYLKKRLFYFY